MNKEEIMLQLKMLKEESNPVCLTVYWYGIAFVYDNYSLPDDYAYEDDIVEIKKISDVWYITLL